MVFSWAVLRRLSKLLGVVCRLFELSQRLERMNQRIPSGIAGSGGRRAVPGGFG